MEKLHLETQHKNLQKNKKGMQQQVHTQTKILGATLFLEVTPKNKIIIAKEQRVEAARLFKDYSLNCPGWLRNEFKLNQRRRKLLNSVLFEAGVDDSYCGKCVDDEDWSGLLHLLWHQINGVTECK